jgi:hypothetical protein
MLCFVVLSFLTSTLQNWASKPYPHANQAIRCIPFFSNTFPLYLECD